MANEKVIGHSALQPGDFVFLHAPPSAVARHIDTADRVSSRLLPRSKPKVYEISKMPTDALVYLVDPSTRSKELGFSQPVHVSRLTPFTLCELEEPIKPAPLRLQMYRNGQWLTGSVLSQFATGEVSIQFEGSDATELVDLSQEEYRWLYTNTSGTIEIED